MLVGLIVMLLLSMGLSNMAYADILPEPILISINPLIPSQPLVEFCDDEPEEDQDAF
jgi:hypothetical protein